MVIILIDHTISNEVDQSYKANKNPFVTQGLFFYMLFGCPETSNSQANFGSQWCCPKILNSKFFSKSRFLKIQTAEQ